MKKSALGQSGQVALVVLLVAAVILTIGISVASRSVTEVKLTSEEEESTESFNVAEAGLEDLLAGTLTDNLAGESGFKDVGGDQIYYEITPQQSLVDVPVEPGHSLEFDVTGGGGTNSIQVSWSDASDPAFVITIIDTAGTTLKRVVFNSDVDRVNNFGVKSSPQSIGLVNNAKMARIKVLYESGTVSVSGDWADVPVQYHTVKSQALTTGSSRTVLVNKTKPQLPSIFDYVLFSGTSL